jgi:hypothetical protein
MLDRIANDDPHTDMKQHIEASGDVTPLRSLRP